MQLSGYTKPCRNSILPGIIFMAVCLLLALPYTNSRAQISWQVLETNTNLDLLGLQCLAEDTLIVFGDNGILLKSTDGGVSFTSFQNSGALIYTAAFFNDLDTGFAGNGGGNVLRTTDGGSSWSVTGGCVCYITDICFSDDQHGIYGGPAGVFRSTDGGNSWSEVSNPPFFVPHRLVAFHDSVFIAIYLRACLKSTDYGQTWIADTVNDNTNYSLSALSFIDSQTGFTITGDGQLFRTNDQAASWNLVSATGLPNVIKLAFADSLNGFLVSNQVNIYRTVNGGLNWTFDFTAPEAVSKLEATSHTVYGTGQNGMILKREMITGMHPPAVVHGIYIYPNPVTETFMIEGTKQPMSVSVFNNMGNMVLYSKMNGGRMLDVSGLSNGIYWLRITEAAQTKMIQFEKL